MAETVPNTAQFQQLTVQVAALGGLGDGIARTPDGEVVLVPGGLPGDLVRLELGARARGVRRSTLLHIEQPSADRVVPPCTLFDRCGGCTLQHWTLPAQVAWKRDQLARAVGLSADQLATPQAVTPQGHRRRVRLHLRPWHGQLQAGMLAARSDALAGSAACLVLEPALEQLRTALGPALDGAIEVGEAHAVLGQQGVLVDVTGRPGAAPAMSAELLARQLGACGVALQIGRHRDPWGLTEVDLPEVTGPMRVRVDGAGFCQASAEANRQIRAAVDEALAACADLSHVQEFYAGSGNLTSLALARGATVRAVEVDDGAADRLQRSARQAGFSEQLQVICAPAEAAVATARQGEVWLLDPGRPGAAEVVQAAARFKPRAIIYVSCAFDTLARDLRTLTTAGYAVQRAAVIDAFAWTVHAEAVVLLTRPAV